MGRRNRKPRPLVLAEDVATQCTIHEHPYRGRTWTYFTLPAKGFQKIVGVHNGDKFTWVCAGMNA